MKKFHETLNFRTLAMDGIGIESKDSVKRGRVTDFFLPTFGEKSIGVIVNIGDNGYEIMDKTTYKFYFFKFYNNHLSIDTPRFEQSGLTSDNRFIL